MQVVIDTFNDNQNAFLFGTNPVGIEYDGQVAREGQTGGFAASTTQRGMGGGFNVNWDGDWSVRSQITERGWETELAIPLKTLRYNPGSNRTWGINVMRNIRRKNEQVYLAPIPRGYNIYRISLAAKMTGLDLPQRRDIKMIPYGLGNVDEYGLVEEDQVESDLDAGLDVKWGMTPQVTADFTVNTDFAQVESDQQQINLTRFPLFFPEKRPFFLENASTFQFGTPREVDLFFSRRIGLDKNGFPIDILAGARLSGKVGSFNVGVLDMQTRDKFDRQTDDLVASSSNYFVARLQREMGRSNFGAIFVNRQGTGDFAGSENYNRAYGLDGTIQATENTKVFTFLAGSTSPGETGTDYAGRALVSYATTWWNGHIGYQQVGEDFNAEVGFVPRTGYRKPQAAFHLEYQPQRYPWIRRISPHVQWNTYYGFDGQIQTSHGHFHFFEIQEQSGGRFGAVLDHRQDQPTEAFTIYTGLDGRQVVIPPGLYTWNEWQVMYLSDPSAPLSFNGLYTFGDFYDGDLKRYWVGLNFRIGAKFNTSVNWNRSDVDLPYGSFTTDLVPFRVSYAFTPLYSIQALIQYNNQTATVSSNIRLALLNRSGTGLFVVYNDVRDTYSIRRTDPDTGVLFPNVLGRSFIVKYTYLFDF